MSLRPWWWWGRATEIAGHLSSSGSSLWKLLDGRVSAGPSDLVVQSHLFTATTCFAGHPVGTSVPQRPQSPASRHPNCKGLFRTHPSLEVPSFLSTVCALPSHLPKAQLDHLLSSQV